MQPGATISTSVWLEKKWPLFVPHGRICLENWQDGDIIFVDVYVLDEFETLS